MGVKPVEYEHVSSKGAGFADAGDSVPIQSDNADTIYKDVSLGYTKKLDQAQTTLLDSMSDPDNIEYDQGESRLVGRQQVDASKTENNDGLKTVGAEVGIAAATKGGAVMNAAGGSTGGVVGQGLNQFDNYAHMQKGANKIAEIPFAALGAGAISLGIGIAALVSAQMFDDQYNNRVNYKDQEGDIEGVLQSFSDKITADMKTNTDNMARYGKLIDDKKKTGLDMIAERDRLQNQISINKAQGLDTTDLENQLKALGEDENNDDINNIKDSLAASTNRIIQSRGASDSASEVSEFLKDGKLMGVLGSANSLALLACGVLMIGGTIIAAKAALKAPFVLKIPAAACAIAGAAMMIAGNISVLVAAKDMAEKTVDEFKCGDKGGDLETKVGDLNKVIKLGDEIATTSDSNILSMDEKLAKALGEAQQNSNNDKGNVLPPPKNNDEGDKK